MIDCLEHFKLFARSLRFDCHMQGNEQCCMWLQGVTKEQAQAIYSLIAHDLMPILWSSLADSNSYQITIRP